MANSTVGAPCAQGNVIPFPIRNAAPDPSRTFLFAFNDTMTAKAEFELSGYHCDRARLLGDEAALEDMQRLHWHIWERWRQAAVRLAGVPAQSLRQLDMKRRAIGRAWLDGEGWFYDGLKAGVAADEARLRPAKAKRG